MNASIGRQIREEGPVSTLGARPVRVQAMALERELAKYNAELPRLLESIGKYVVICGDEVVGVYNDYEDALTEGYARCGTGPFLVKQIEHEVTVYHFTRDIDPPCPH
jgi:hypothetical protein